MNLLIFNGSPRRQKSNSTILAEHFIKGYLVEKEETPVMEYLSVKERTDEYLEMFSRAENVLFIFPLYTDCMPGLVKAFFEKLALLDFKKPKNLGFVVQSGFPEAIHSVYLERYLEKLTRRLRSNYIGTIIKGGVEGIQIMPPYMTGKLFRSFFELGRYFAKTGAFEPGIVKRLRTPMKMSKLRRIGFQVFSFTGLQNFYWNSNLKKNRAFEKRFDKPYESVM